MGSSSAVPLDPLRGLFDAEPANDPIEDWIQAHLEELRPHAGKRVAIDPDRGLIAVGDSYEAVADQLAALGIAPNSGVVIVPLYV